MNGRRGFTLIELLVAMGIFAILALLAYGGLNSMLTTRAQTEQSADALRALQFAYRMLERDIEDWVPRDIRNEFGESSPALLAGSQIGYALELTRGGWRNPAEQPRSTLQRVAYRVQDNALQRDSWLALDRPADELPREQVLLEGVRELRLRFLDANDAWQEQWPPAGQQSGQQAALRALETVVVTERWGELRWLFLLPE